MLGGLKVPVTDICLGGGRAFFLVKKELVKSNKMLRTSFQLLTMACVRQATNLCCFIIIIFITHPRTLFLLFSKKGIG